MRFSDILDEGNGPSGTSRNVSSGKVERFVARNETFRQPKKRLEMGRKICIISRLALSLQREYDLRLAGSSRRVLEHHVKNKEYATKPSENR